MNSKAASESNSAVKTFNSWFYFLSWFNSFISSCSNHSGILCAGTFHYKTSATVFLFEWSIFWKFLYRISGLISVNTILLITPKSLLQTGHLIYSYVPLLIQIAWINKLHMRSVAFTHLTQHLMQTILSFYLKFLKLIWHF